MAHARIATVLMDISGNFISKSVETHPATKLLKAHSKKKKKTKVTKSTLPTAMATALVRLKTFLSVSLIRET